MSGKPKQRECTGCGHTFTARPAAAPARPALRPPAAKPPRPVRSTPTYRARTCSWCCRSMKSASGTLWIPAPSWRPALAMKAEFQKLSGRGGANLADEMTPPKSLHVITLKPWKLLIRPASCSTCRVAWACCRTSPHGRTSSHVR